MLFLFYLNIKIYSNLKFSKKYYHCAHNKKACLCSLSLNSNIIFQFYSEDIFSNSQLLNFSYEEVVSLWSSNVTDIIWFPHNHSPCCRIFRTWRSFRAKFRIWKMFFCSRKAFSGWLRAQQKARWFIIWLCLALSGCFTEIVQEVWILQSSDILYIYLYISIYNYL